MIRKLESIGNHLRKHMCTFYLLMLDMQAAQYIFGVFSMVATFGIYKGSGTLLVSLYKNAGTPAIEWSPTQQRLWTCH